MTSRRNIYMVILISIILGTVFGKLYFQGQPIDEKENIENEILSILKTGDIVGISQESLWIDSPPFLCHKFNSHKGECVNKIQKYTYLLNGIISGQYITCGKGIIIHTITNSLHYIYYDNNLKYILESGIHFQKRYRSWLKYYIDSDRFQDLGGCYPWNNLEDYWKIHGKASPEEIQKVIEAVAR